MSHMSKTSEYYVRYIFPDNSVYITHVPDNSLEEALETVESFLARGFRAEEIIHITREVIKVNA